MSYMNTLESPYHTGLLHQGKIIKVNIFVTTLHIHFCKLHLPTVPRCVCFNKFHHIAYFITMYIVPSCIVSMLDIAYTFLYIDLQMLRFWTKIGTVTRIAKYYPTFVLSSKLSYTNIGENCDYTVLPSMPSTKGYFLWLTKWIVWCGITSKAREMLYLCSKNV